MTTIDWTKRLEAALEDVRLLDHPFYKRWECGMLSAEELSDYASQYRHFEKAFPQILGHVVSNLPEGTARDFVQANLDDEVGPPSHLELFDSFLDAANGDAEAAPSPAITNLLETYKAVITESPLAGLGAIAAYELQSPEVAASKGEGLRAHYGFDANGSKFWDVHATVDVTHAEWATAALDAAAKDSADSEAAIEATRRIAEAWWGFLDEREALAPAVA